MRSDFSFNLGGLVYIFLFYFVDIVKPLFQKKTPLAMDASILD